MGIEEKERNLGFLITGAVFGAVTGVAAGAVMGLLFAPKSGKETRAGLGDWLEEKRDKGSELLAKIKEQGQHRKEQLTAAIKAGRLAYAETAKHG
ncbi:MAG: YtxH domain-containing protein [Elusimicrobia bacterium]|nr:YtxH domain-containing protein [Elusimicrobiota bacterium]